MTFTPRRAGDAPRRDALLGGGRVGSVLQLARSSFRSRGLDLSSTKLPFFLRVLSKLFAMPVCYGRGSVFGLLRF